MVGWVPDSLFSSHRVWAQIAACTVLPLCSWLTVWEASAVSWGGAWRGLAGRNSCLKLPTY